LERRKLNALDESVHGKGKLDLRLIYATEPRDGQDLSFDNFSMVDLFIPPLDEQARIATHIKSSCEKIDTGVSIKQDQIAALKEYKTSLINAAVTGKIKVI